VEAAANLIKETDASLVGFENVNNAIAAGYTERLATNGEEHLLCQGGRIIIAGFCVALPGQCDPSAWKDLHHPDAARLGGSPTRAASSPTT